MRSYSICLPLSRSTHIAANCDRFFFFMADEYSIVDIYTFTISLWHTNFKSLEIVVSFPLDICSEVKLLDHMVVLFLSFLGSSILFSIVAIPIYNPINSVQELPFCTFILAFVITHLWWWASQVALVVKNLPANEGHIRDVEDRLEEGMEIHSSILAWRIPWTEEPGRQQSMGSQRVRHDWSGLTHTHTHTHTHLMMVILIGMR